MHTARAGQYVPLFMAKHREQKGLQKITKDEMQQDKGKQINIKTQQKEISLPLCLELMTDSVSVAVVYSSAILLLWPGLKENGN